MKRNTSLFMAATLVCILAASVSWGFTWYVDPVTGDDDETRNPNPTYGNPLLTISEAIERAASSGDIIRLFSGDFAHEGFKHMIWNNINRYTFIDVNKSITIERVSSTFHPQIVGFYNTMAGTDSLTNSSIMLFRASDISVKYISFDGYNYYYHQGYGGVYNPDSLEVSMPHCSTIFISANAPNAKVEGCTFFHMGRSIKADSDSDTLKYEAVIGAHPTGIAGGISGIEVKDNLFYDNEFDTSHGHEIYFTTCYDAEISGNTIYNNGVGVPLRFSKACHDIDIENNYVCGAALHGFINDHNQTEEFELWSNNIRVNNNVFSDTTFVYSCMYPLYYGPIISQYDGFNTRFAYISEFRNNVIAEKDSVIYPDDDVKAFKIYGVASDADKVYVSVHRTDENRTRVYAFDEKNGPVLRPLWYSSLGEKPINEICRTDDYIIVNTINGVNNSLYKFNNPVMPLIQ